VTISLLQSLFIYKEIDMKSLKIGLRVWIAMTSLLSFLAGWGILSHSGKPVSLFADPGAASLPDPVVQSQVLLPTLEPLPSLADLTTTGVIQSLPALPSAPNVSINNNFTPRLRTRGS
jgi:hypothetical protein